MLGRRHPEAENKTGSSVGPDLGPAQDPAQMSLLILDDSRRRIEGIPKLKVPGGRTGPFFPRSQGSLLRLHLCM